LREGVAAAVTEGGRGGVWRLRWREERQLASSMEERAGRGGWRMRWRREGGHGFDGGRDGSDGGCNGGEGASAAAGGTIEEMAEAGAGARGKKDLMIFFFLIMI
jgi:hypothetical protein